MVQMVLDESGAREPVVWTNQSDGPIIHLRSSVNTNVLAAWFLTNVRHERQIC